VFNAVVKQKLDAGETVTFTVQRVHQP